MFRSLIIAAAALASAAPLAAQSADPMVGSMAGVARRTLGHDRPIVPAALDQQTVRRGALTAQVQACGGQWQTKSYLPYMAQLRASGRYSEKQLTYVGVLHGIAQQVVLKSLESRADPCPARMRAAVAAVIER